MRSAVVRALEATVGRPALDRARAVRRALVRMGRRRAVALTVRRLHRGTSEPEPTAPIVLCLVKDGAEWASAFLDYHLRLGFEHIVLLDNGSTDGTPEIASRYARVTVLRCTRPFEEELRGYLLNRYARRRWVLLTDIDMNVDYPYSDVLSLRQLLDYLDAHGYNAMPTYLLDMFPEGALEDSAGAPGGFVASHRFYDISAMDVLPYPDHLGCIVDSPAILRRAGGIRRTVFNVPRVELINHPLVRYEPGMWFGSPHYFLNMRVADVAGVMYHYKFMSSFRERVKHAVATSSHWSNAAENRGYLETLRASPKTVMRRSTARELNSAYDLIDNGFLPVSARYHGWAARARASSPPEPTL